MSIIPEFFGDESTYWWRFHGWRDDRKPTSIYRANSKGNVAFYQKLLEALSYVPLLSVCLGKAPCI